MALRHGLNCVTQAKPKGGNGLARRPICRSATTTQVESVCIWFGCVETPPP